MLYRKAPVTVLMEHRGIRLPPGYDRVSPSLALELPPPRLWRAEGRTDKPKAHVKPKPAARETEIIKAVGEGQSRREMDGRLYISEHTVHNHRTRIYRKLHIFDRTQAGLYAVRHGIVEPRLVPDA